MAKETKPLDSKLDELIAKLQGQQLFFGDRMMRMMVSSAIKLSRRKAKDKAEHDKVIREHEGFQVFCISIGFKEKDLKKLTGGQSGD